MIDRGLRVIRAVVVDDHAMFRESVRRVLDVEEDVTLVGEAGAGDEARDVIELSRPDLVLLDLRLAEASGLDLLPRLVTIPSAPKVLIVTAFPDASVIAEAFRLGANGVVLKELMGGTLLSAIRAV